METLHAEELNELYSSPKLFRVIISRKVRWECQIALIGRGEAYTGFWWGNPRERDHLRDAGIDWRIILGWIFTKWNVGAGMDPSGSGYGQVAATCDFGNDLRVPKMRGIS